MQFLVLALTEEMDERLFKKRGTPDARKATQSAEASKEAKKTSLTTDLNADPDPESGFVADTSRVVEGGLMRSLAPATSKKQKVVSGGQATIAATTALSENLDAINSKRPSKIGAMSNKEKALWSGAKANEFPLALVDSHISTTAGSSDTHSNIGVASEIDLLGDLVGISVPEIEVKCETEDKITPVPAIVPFGSRERIVRGGMMSGLYSTKKSKVSIEIDRKCTPSAPDAKPGPGGLRKNR